MKFLWFLGCFLTGVELLAVATGAKESSFLQPGWEWTSIIPAIGWFYAAYRATREKAKWL